MRSRSRVGHTRAVSYRWLYNQSRLHRRVSCWRLLCCVLCSYRPFEMLRSQRQRTNFLLAKQAKIVAMTCTHAALTRRQLVQLGFKYDNIVMEEAAQVRMRRRLRLRCRHCLGSYKLLPLSNV